MARTVTKSFVPYHLAVQVVREAHITTRQKYFDWHKATRPLYLPSQPQAHYSEWTSWNDFLGTTNSFEKTTRRKIADKRVWRPFWEAVRYAQQMARQFKITTQNEWVAFHKEYDVPRDIPCRPNQVYPEFTGSGWGVWLGKNIDNIVVAAKEGVAVLGLHTIVDKPRNVIVPRVWGNGYASMLTKLGEDDSGMLCHPFRVYDYEVDQKGNVDRLFAQFSSTQPDGTHIVTDVNSLLWELDNLLLIHKV